MLGSSKVLTENALIYLFGDGFRVNGTKIPQEETLEQSIRHFDQNGLWQLPLGQQVVTTTNGPTDANVTVSYYYCGNCGKIYYRIEDVAVIAERRK